MANPSRVKIATAVTNDLLANPQKAIFKHSCEIRQPPAAESDRWFGTFQTKWWETSNCWCYKFHYYFQTGDGALDKR